MQEISGRDKEAIKAELAGVIYKNPEGAWEPVDQYLSGNVKAKLAIARKAAARDPAYQGNVDALEKVQPADIEAVDISVRLGSPWVPPEDVSAFIESILKAKPTSLHYTAAIPKWFLTMPHTGTNEMRTVWGAITEDDHGGKHGWDAVDIIGSVLNNTPILVRENHGTKDEPHWVTLDAETRLAQQKAEDIRIKFGSWLWEDQTRRERLVRKYNDTYNTNVLRVFDGSHLTLPGTNPAIQLTPNKKHAVWRMVQDKAVLLDHVVGSGKTFTTAAGFMELRRLGLMKKGIVVVPNHLVKQWRDEWYALYPNANVLAATEQDFDKENRQRLFSRIATGDWDAVIVPHTSFTKIGMPADVQHEILSEQINDLTDAIEELKRDKKGRDPSVRQMEKVRERMKERMERLSQTGEKDQAVTFDELGIDGMAVDEAHLFKNLFYYTQMRGVAGLGDPSGSQRAFDLFVKSRYLNKINGRTIFATGTPVSNSLVEMFTMQRYMSYDDLKARGVHHLDSWAGVYGNITQVWEIDPSGQGSRLATRFAKFVNLPELMTSYRTFADVLTMTDLQEQFQANEGKRYPVPRIKGGKPQNFVADRSPGQEWFFGVQEPVLDEDGKPVLDDKGRPRKAWNEGSILHRIENMPKDPHEDNMLKVTNDARFAGLDLRTMLPGSPDFKDSKINHAVANIVRIYKAWGDDLGTQLVFLDLSKPAGKKAAKAAPAPVAPAEEGGEAEEKQTVSMDELLAERVKFSVYDDVKAKLIAAGIPEREIAFIHDANTSEQKRTLFGKVNRGEIRVLMGSTAKMGAGTNAQRRLVGLHHLDAPWRPSDLEQREGRIIRRGNSLYDRDPDGFEVEIVRYATKQTYDTRMWQLLEHKARAIEQIRRGAITSRTTEDVDGEAANAAEMKAAASGNPLIMEEIKLRTNVQKLEGLEQASKRQRFALESQARRLEQAPERVMQVKKRIEPFIAARQPKPEKGFVYTTEDGQKITDANKLAGPLMEGIKAAVTNQQRAPAGEYRGLHLTFVAYGSLANPAIDVVATVGPHATGDAAVHAQDRYSLTTYMKGQEFSASGFLTRLDNAYEHFEERIADAEKQAAREQAELVKVKAELAKPWERADELERARAEHRRVLALIDAGETGEESMPVVPPPGGNMDPVAMNADGLRSLLTSAPESEYAGGTPVADVQAVVDRVAKSVRNIATGGVKVVEVADQLPPRLRDYLYSQNVPDTVEGLFDPVTQSIYLIAHNIDSPAGAQFVVYHELFGHYGLRGFFGNRLDSVLGGIWMKNANVRKEAAALTRKFGYGQTLATEEALANMAGRGIVFTDLKRLIAAMQKALREMGFDAVADFLERLSDAEALELLAQARAWVIAKDEPHVFAGGMEPAYKRSDAPGFDEWIEGTAVVDAAGKPKTVFRGEWGGRPGRNPFINTRMGTPTFTDVPDLASAYAVGANDLMPEERYTGNARVGMYYLAIKNPADLGPNSLVSVGALRSVLKVGKAITGAEFQGVIKDIQRWRGLQREDDDVADIERAVNVNP